MSKNTAETEKPQFTIWRILFCWTDILHNATDILRNVTDILHNETDILHNVTYILHNVTDILHNDLPTFIIIIFITVVYYLGMLSIFGRRSEKERPDI